MVTNYFLNGREKPHVFLSLVPDLVSKIVKTKTCGENFVDVVSFFNHVSGLEHILVKNMKTVSKIYALINLLPQLEIRHKDQFELMLSRSQHLVAGMLHTEFLLQTAYDMLYEDLVKVFLLKKIVLLF